MSIELHLQFLIRSNHADLLILKQTKETVRVSICHTATVIANAFMHSGTTSDQFLRCVSNISFILMYQKQSIENINLVMTAERNLLYMEINNGMTVSDLKL